MVRPVYVALLSHRHGGKHGWLSRAEHEKTGPNSKPNQGREEVTAHHAPYK
jgi:hypothetical protein